MLLANSVSTMFLLLLAGTVATVRAENSVRFDPDSVHLEARLEQDENGDDGEEYQIPTRVATASVALDSDDITTMPSISFPTMAIEGSSRSTGEPAMFTKMTSYTRDLEDGEMKIWQGAIDGDEIGFATLVRSADGKMAGSFTVGDTSYTLSTMPDGSTEVRAVLFSDLPDEGDEDSEEEAPDGDGSGGSPFQPIGYDDPPHRALRGKADEETTHPVANKLDIREATMKIADSQRMLQQNSIVDVLVIVTNRAMCEAAGRSRGCSSSNRGNIEQALRVAEAQTNTAMQAIGVPAGIRIVGIHHDTTGFDGNAGSSSLYALSNRNDGSLDYIHSMRDQVGADLVALITGHTSACGVGFKPGEFSVTARACLGGYTFTHELGHNLGCYHNPEAGTSSPHAFGNGYRRPDYQFRTVMSYDCPGGCPRIPYFSTDDYVYGGRAMGDSTHDNARMITATAAGTAANRPTAGGGGGGGGGNNYFYIINPATDKALDVSGARCSDGTNIHLWTRNGTPAQVFRFGDNNAIINVQCNKAIDVHGANCGTNTNIHLWRQNGTGAQRFRVDNDGTIVSTLCNKAIDIDSRYGGADGSNIKIYPKNGYWDQQWRIEYI